MGKIGMIWQKIKDIIEKLDIRVGN